MEVAEPELLRAELDSTLVLAEGVGALYRASVAGDRVLVVVARLRTEDPSEAAPGEGAGEGAAEPVERGER